MDGPVANRYRWNAAGLPGEERQEHQVSDDPAPRVRPSMLDTAHREDGVSKLALGQPDRREVFTEGVYTWHSAGFEREALFLRDDPMGVVLPWYEDCPRLRIQPAE